jgi:drug/metabolite transporter (DMT)-like permease
VSPGKPGLPRGVAFALGSAVLFALSTPAAKRLLGDIHPVLLAGLLYGGSGVGLFLLRLVRGTRSQAPLTRHDVPWLVGAVLFGGILGPVLLFLGLRLTPASTASLLLNLEGVFTALLAWFVFHENFDRRIASGMALIVAGGVVLSWPTGGEEDFPVGAAAIAAACLCWAIDNNLTQRLSGGDPVQVAAIKGGVSSAVNLAAAAVLGVPWPSLPLVAASLLVGFAGYGVSLALFVVALRHVGTARTGAYFSVAPFVGALASLALLGEPMGTTLALAALLMGAGVWLHLTERHEHEHGHDRLVHAHRHAHDEHHRHGHSISDPEGEPHTHEHAHEPLTHRHLHFPDIHHRHPHDGH